MTELATICIPIAPFHHAVSLAAYNSALSQTIPCHVTIWEDPDGRGAAWARNQLLAAVQSPFVVFLDADDTLDEQFVELTVNRYITAGGGVYVYTDWYNGDKISITPDTFSMNKDGMVHVVTTLLPTAMVRFVGGFDETVPATTDHIDLYHKLHVAGLCGVREAAPLMTYRRWHGRGTLNAETQASDVRDQAEKEMYHYYKMKYGVATMCNCGQPGGVQAQAVAACQPGDVQVRAMYTPQHKASPTTKRKYQRAGDGQIICVTPQDAALRPDLWRPVASLADLTPDVDVVSAMAQAAFRGA